MRNSLKKRLFAHLYSILVISCTFGLVQKKNSPQKVSRFTPLNRYYIIIDEVFFDNFLVIIYLLVVCNATNNGDCPQLLGKLISAPELSKHLTTSQCPDIDATNNGD
jgi:hypothetical protein